MIDQLVTFDTAKLAKEKGFDLPCPYRYIKDRSIDFWGYDPNYEHGFHRNNVCVGISAPTQSFLQKWLRENHAMHINVTYIIHKDVWCFSLIDIKNRELIDYDESITFEEALESGLQEALKQINP